MATRLTWRGCRSWIVRETGGTHTGGLDFGLDQFIVLSQWLRVAQRIESGRANTDEHDPVSFTAHAPNAECAARDRICARAREAIRALGV